MKKLYWIMFTCEKCRNIGDVNAFRVSGDWVVHFKGECEKCNILITTEISIQKLIDLALKNRNIDKGNDKGEWIDEQDGLD